MVFINGSDRNRGEEEEYGESAQTMMERELERKQKGISEHTMLKIIPEDIRDAMHEEQLKKGCFRFEKRFCDFYRVDKGIEFSFEKYSF